MPLGLDPCGPGLWRVSHCPGLAGRSLLLFLGLSVPPASPQYWPHAACGPAQVSQQVTVPITLPVTSAGSFLAHCGCFAAIPTSHLPEFVPWSSGLVGMVKAECGHFVSVDMHFSVCRGAVGHLAPPWLTWARCPCGCVGGSVGGEVAQFLWLHTHSCAVLSCGVSALVRL